MSRQLFDNVYSTYTYLIASQHGGEALIIDPVLETIDHYLQPCLRARSQASQGRRHAFARRPCHRTGCAVGPYPLHHSHGRANARRRLSMRVTEGDCIKIEGLSLDVLYTPGIPAIPIRSSWAIACFTGDTLLIRGTGRTDFQNGDARAQYVSPQDQLGREYVHIMHN